MMQDPDELLRQAIYEQSQRGSHYPSSYNDFPVPLPPIPTADDPYVLEDHPMNTVDDDDYEIYVDHGDGQKIKSRKKEKKKEIFIGPDGRPLPEDVQEQIRGYGTEQDTMSFLESFINDAVAGVPYTLPDQQMFYETGGKVHQMRRPIKQDRDLKYLMDTMNRRYGLKAMNQGPSTPIKYYPDLNQGQGGYMPHMGGTYPANVRPKRGFV
tara:strand:+ start:168 stop:797 length:630 start_codon:yes stop_codon:yes gene_type:complete